MREKRKVDRFDLHIETILNVQDEAIMDKVPILLTRNISCSGVFLTTSNPLPIDTRVDLDLLLNQNELDSGSLKNKRINISTSGKVVRTNGQGMAVEFDKLYKISKLMI
jgi:hypothetical protein